MICKPLVGKKKVRVDILSIRKLNAGVTRARNLRNFSGKFLQLCFDVIIARQLKIVENCQINCASFYSPAVFLVLQKHRTYKVGYRTFH